MPRTSGSRTSAFFAMHGPMNTTRTSAPKWALIARATATIGETTGARASASAGRYLVTYETMAGQAVEITGLPSCIAFRVRRAYSRAMSSAPKATSHTSANPSRRSAEMTLPASMPGKATGKEGARHAITLPPPASRCRTGVTASSTFFAPCVQRRTQWPQATHSSAITMAWPWITLIARAGHSRTQL